MAYGVYAHKSPGFCQLASELVCVVKTAIFQIYKELTDNEHAQ